MCRLLLVVLAVACGVDDGPAEVAPVTDTGPTYTPTTVDAPTDTGPDPWQVEGQEGSLVTVYRHFAPGLPRGFDVHAVFADQLPIDDYAWCLAGGPCADARPAPDGFVELLPAPPTDGVAFSWLGDEIEVWRLDLPFVTLTDPTVGYYSHTVGNKPDDDDLTLRIPDGGEWGEFANSAVPVAPALDVLAPDPDERVDLSGPTLDFEWVPTGVGEVFLVVDGVRGDGSPIGVAYMLVDDGAFALDLALHGLGPDSDVTLRIGRRVTDAVEVNGNTLLLTGVDEQPYRPECAPWPDVDVPGPNALGPRAIDPWYFAITLDGVLADGAFRDFTPEGADAPTSSRAIATFYDQGFDPLCKVIYDVSGDRTVAVDPWPGADIDGRPLTVEAAWDVDLQDGWTDCGPAEVLSVFTGTDDPRAYLDLFDVGVGIGDTLQQPGGTRSGFVTLDRAVGYEFMEAFGYELRDCDLAITSHGMLPPGSAVQDAYWQLPYSGVVWTITR